MTFYNHCNNSLYNEAIRLIAQTDWADVYKEQTLDNVSDELECGHIIRTNSGSYTSPFKISDVKGIISIVANRYTEYPIASSVFKAAQNVIDHANKVYDKTEKLG